MSPNEENYRLLFESNPEAMWVFDTATLRFLAVNDAALARYGYSRKEFLSMTVKNIRPSSDISKLEQHLQQHPAGTKTPTCFRHRKKDGTEIDVEILAYPITFDGHDARLILARDITELKRKEHQIRLFAHAFESTTEMISLTDLENRFTFVNKSFLAVYGYEEQEILGRQPAVLGSPKNPQKIHDEILDRTLKYGGWKGELYNRRKDGSEFPVYLNTSVIKDRAGNVIGHIGVAQDITERKLAEEALRATEAEFRALFASMSDVILVIDVQGRYIKIAPTNPALLY